MKGIILAGGLSTRLYPATKLLSKQLLPVYDKPMIYYPLCTLMHAGIENILIITTPYEQEMFKQLLGDGSQWGINLEYTVQEKPEGIAQAFIISEQFIDNQPICLILGDNILYGEGLAKQLQEGASLTQGAHIFGYYVSDPERYGVIEFSGNRPINIVEKPDTRISNHAVIGIYFYDSEVVDIARSLKPSKRGELEITDINKHYLKQNQLTVSKLSRGVAWLDTGTHVSLLDAANFIHVLEKRQGLKIGCPEEIAWRMNLITNEQLKDLAAPQVKSGYGQYLLNLIA